MLILVIDDDQEDQEIFVDATKLIDPLIECVTFRDGHQALAYMDNAILLPDFVFVDINMPEMGGIEILKIIKSKSTLQSIPVIVYSTAQPSELNQLQALGARFLKKASTYAELVAQLKGVFGSVK